MYEKLMELYGHMAKAAYSGQDAAEDAHMNPEMYEFMRRARKGDFDPVKEGREDRDKLAAGREPLTDEEYAARVAAIEANNARLRDQSRQVALCLAMAMGAIDALLMGDGGPGPVVAHVRKAGTIMRMDGECLRELEEALRRFLEHMPHGERGPALCPDRPE